MDIYVTYKMLPCGYMYYTTCKILSANTGLGSANIQRCYTTDCTAVVSAQWNDSYTSQNKWCKTHSFLDLFVHLSYNTTCLCVILRSPLHFVSSCGLDKIRQTRKNNQLYLTTTCVITYIYLLPGSSQRCGTLRSLAWAFPTSGGELIFNNDRCYACNGRQGKSRRSYHSPSSPVTYQPQRTQLLSDVNVFGGLFLCWSTLRMLVTKKLQKDTPR